VSKRTPVETTPAGKPFEERFFPIDGARMRYLHAGSGPPLVLVHGLMGYSFSWRRSIPVFAQHAEVFAVDLLGTGFSDRPANIDLSFKACAERLLRFADSVCKTPFDLLGTSHGGAVSMTAATLAPQRIRRLILVAPANPWAPRGTSLAPFLSNPLVTPLALQIVPLLKEYYFRRLFADPRRILPGTLEGYKLAIDRPGSFEYAISILRTWNQDFAELKAALPKIADIPTLLLWGDRDVAVAPQSAEPLKKNFRNSELIMMKGIGHLPYEEAPEEFNRIVAKFLFS
jgi:pimeloyl-ACP methyl ester carboxylesterase